MPAIKKNVSLRDDPNGAKIGKVAHAGDGVTIIETKDGWSHVEVDNAGKDKGWVASTFIDNDSNGPEAPPIDNQKFANSCVIQALINVVNPHFLVGVAQQRSGITGGKKGDRIGPYRFTVDEWKAIVPPFTENDIDSNNQQIAGFALMVQSHMATLGADATPLQLYRAQWPDAPADIEAQLTTAFKDTADIEAKAEADILDPPALDAGNPGPAVQNLRAANQQRWQNMQIDEGRLSKLDDIAKRLVASAAKQRYEKISAITHVPWFVIAVIHQREASQKFSANIAQGDPWNQVSVRVPAGRGPFTSFEDAAVDALTKCHPFAARWGDWSIGGALTLLEQYNGLGYALRRLPSPYIWASTNQYIKGKFTADHHFDPDFVDPQLGCAPLLARMQVQDASIVF